jgi:site-specific DNA recombinase
VVRNTHEPIIDQESFDLVQKLITSRRSGDTKWGENIFAGLLECVDCGYKMRRLHVHREKKDDQLANLGYACTSYALFGKERCTYHWLEARDLYDAVLADIRFHARQAMKNSDAFARQIMERKSSKRKVDSIEQSRELKKSRSRLSELWANAIQQYIDTMELNAPMLHELIEKITVGERKLENGEQTQAITIYYRFVGNIS